MFDGANVTYVYDGSFDGLMSCVFESFVRKEIPLTICPSDEYQPSLFECRFIETDSDKARRVTSGIRSKISDRAYFLVCDGFLTCLKQKELYILKFIVMGFDVGSRITAMLGDDTVSVLHKAVRHLGAEANHMLGFVRFSVYEDAMVSVIEPDNFVLPKIAAHFCDRYPNENFMIYDKKHRFALIYSRGRQEILPVEDFTEPDASDEEYYYRSMWKMFYDTIAIQERNNPKCRMSHMAKHYWSHMTEMNEDFTRRPSIGSPTDNKRLSN